MDLELQLWDDTRSQVIQFYFGNLFRRGKNNKIKLLYHLRICQVTEEGSLSPILEIYNRESLLEDWEVLSTTVRDLILARREKTSFTPREQDILMNFGRILTTPQVITKVSIDGIAYMIQTPEITGHINIAFKFWTTIDILKKFQIKLNQILQNREFKANIEQRPALEVKSLYDVDDKDIEKDVEEDGELDEKIIADADDKDEVKIVKHEKTSTEMLNKIEQESYTSDNKTSSAEGNVELADWDAGELVEVGGENDIDKNELVEEKMSDVRKSETAETNIEKSRKRTVKTVDKEVKAITKEKEEKPKKAVPKARKSTKSKTVKTSSKKADAKKEKKPASKKREASTKAKKTPAKKSVAKKTAEKESDNKK